MSATLNADVGAADANAFVTAQEFFDYVSTRLNADAGLVADDTRTRAIIEATRDLSALIYTGSRVDSTQALSWPRSYAIDPDAPAIDPITLGDLTAPGTFADDVIPQRVKDATCELALQYLKAGTNDLASLDPGIGVIRKKVDVLETEWASPTLRAQGLARFPRVMALISPLLDTGSVGGLTVVRV